MNSQVDDGSQICILYFTVKTRCCCFFLSLISILYTYLYDLCAMLKITACFLFLCIAASTLAQFNDSMHYRFRFAGTGSLNKTQDARAYLLSNGINFDVSQPKIAFNSSAAYTYGQQNHVLTNNDFLTSANLDFGKGKTALYEWALANYQTSYSLKIAYKTQAGAGIGFTILDSPRTQLSISDGFLYEANNLTDATFGNDIYSTVRNSLRVRYKFIIRDIITFNGTNFVQPSILSINDYIVNLNNSVNIKLRQWLNLAANLNYNRINRTKRENLLLTFGISIDRYF